MSPTTSVTMNVDISQVSPGNMKTSQNIRLGTIIGLLKDTDSVTEVSYLKNAG